VQLENTKEASKSNGTTSNLIATVEPDESQMTISEHPVGETTDDVSAWPEWNIEGQPEGARNLSQPSQPKDKI